MKKAIAIVLALAMVFTMAGTVFAAKPGTDFNGPHYNLNLVGKKVDWNGGGSYNNPDRHTIFVPETTDGFSYTLPDGSTQSGSIKIAFTQNTESSDISVLDGNAFDDGAAAVELGKGRYHVYIVAKAKPGFDTNITGWVWFTDNLTNTNWMSMDVGTITVTRKWQDATGLFYVDPGEDNLGLVTDSTWVFDYLNMLASYGYGDGQYFWDYDNNGNKLVQVRFYPDN